MRVRALLLLLVICMTAVVPRGIAQVELEPNCGQMSPPQQLPDGLILTTVRYGEVVRAPTGPRLTGRILGICRQDYLKNGAKYRSVTFWPNGNRKSDCYTDVTNRTCIDNSSDNSALMTTYGDHKQLLSRQETCRGTPMSVEHYDSDGWLDGDFRDGRCGPTGVSMTTIATYKHGALDGPFFSYNCYFTSKGEFRRGLRWGSWRFAPKTDPNCARYLNINVPTVIPSVTLVNGTGEWSKILSYMPSEEGALVGGKEEGLWRYHDWSESTFSLAGTFVHGVMDGEWKMYWTSPAAGALKVGDLRAQFTFGNGAAEGPFVVYDPGTGERVEGSVSAGVPSLACGPQATGFGLQPALFARVPAGIQRGIDWSNGTPGGKPQSIPAPGRIVGVWRFYDASGRLLGEENLGSGDGHFLFWNAAGDKACEGDLIDGMQNGKWILYGPANQTLAVLTYDHGTQIGWHSIPLQAPASWTILNTLPARIPLSAQIRTLTSGSFFTHFLATSSGPLQSEDGKAWDVPVGLYSSDQALSVPGDDPVLWGLFARRKVIATEFSSDGGHSWRMALGDPCSSKPGYRATQIAGLGNFEYVYCSSYSQPDANSFLVLV